MDNNKKMDRVRCILCKEVYDRNRLFSVPTCEMKRKRWTQHCGIDFPRKASICEYHFYDKDFINGRNPEKGRRYLYPGAVPKVQYVAYRPSYVRPNNQVLISATLKTPLPNVSDSANALNEFESQTLEDCDRKDAACQTDEISEGLYRNELHLLQHKLKMLQAQNLKLQTELHSTDSFNIRKLFTNDQMERIINPDKRIRWTVEVIKEAFFLYECYPEAYRVLHNIGYPIPKMDAPDKFEEYKVKP